MATHSGAAADHLTQPGATPRKAHDARRDTGALRPAAVAPHPHGGALRAPHPSAGRVAGAAGHPDLHRRHP